MENIIFIVFGIIVGSIVTTLFFVLKNRAKKAEYEALRQATVLAAQTESEAAAKALTEKLTLAERNLAVAESKLNDITERHKEELASLQSDNTKRRQEQQDLFLFQKKEQLENFMQQKKEQQESFDRQIEALKNEFKNLSQELLDKQTEGLSKSNDERLDNLLMPLKQNIEAFTKAFENDKQTQTESQTRFSEAMKSLAAQTESLGHNAEELTKALKADPKKQGNWGEAVLKNILTASGLREEEDFFCQSAETDSEGDLRYPDVKVLIPGADSNEDKAYAIIDSKVSLKSYIGYMQADDDESRKEYLKAHIKSIRAHVDELAEKDYTGRLKDTFGPVMMFVPNEGSFLLAVENDTSLILYAYNKHVILLSPSSLMLALNLIYLLRQTQRQALSVGKIIDSAKAIYEQFVIVTKSIDDMGSSLEKLSSRYDDLRKRFISGKGNLVRRFEGWKALGITTGRNIDKKLLDEAPIDAATPVTPEEDAEESEESTL
jgi:DNA recombination protein RmuC